MAPPLHWMRSMQMRCKTPCKQGSVIWKQTTPMKHTLSWLQIQKSYHHTACAMAKCHCLATEA